MQIFFKLVNMMGLGMGVNRRVCLCVTGWVGGCGPACVCAYSTCMCVSEGAVRLLKGPLCAAISLWDSGTGSGAHKQSSLFISWKLSEQAFQSESITSGWTGKWKVWEGLGMCITELCGMDR